MASTPDVLIIGAGLAGLSTLYNIRHHFPSWRPLVLEAGPSIGGTWYFNSYPGARVDAESVSYQLTWDPDLLQEWTWREGFATQPDMLRYIERFASKNNLTRDIRLNTTVTSASWDDDRRRWVVTDAAGHTYEATYLISCLGLLSNPTTPRFPDIQNYKGQSFHTSRWPKSLTLADLAGKRVGVVGTGASGIQTITAIATQSQVRKLSVFQRTAGWAAPLRNYDIPDDQQRAYKADWASVFADLATTPGGFFARPDPRKSSEVTQEEREALWEELYAQPGFGKWAGVFSDTYTDREANALYSRWMADKIRGRVKDPALAEKLVPTDHGFGTRRVPLESGYYEVFNQDNVELVDLRASPVQTVTEDAVVTQDGRAHEVDVLVFATGFDAITGSYSGIDWTSKSGRPLLAGDDAIWRGHRAKTTLGILVPDMPNMFMVAGPHQPFANVPRSVERAVNVIVDLLRFCREGGHTYVETSEEAARDWTEHVLACGEGSLVNEVDSWMTGVNGNVDGREERTVACYGGSAGEYQRRCDDMKDRG